MIYNLPGRKDCNTKAKGSKRNCPGRDLPTGLIMKYVMAMDYWQLVILTTQKLHNIRRTLHSVIVAIVYGTLPNWYFIQ